MSADLLDAARKYAEYGWAVVPLHTVKDGICSCRSGAACDKSAGKHPRIHNWQQGERPTVEQVEQWWAQWPDANIGIATGSLSGVVAIDVDDVDAPWPFDQQLPDTARIRTGNGYHLLYQAPDEPLANSVKRLAPGIDVRGEGGLIVAPPSVHYSGRTYEWISKGTPAPLPSWVPEHLSRPKAKEPERSDSGTTAYGNAVLSGEVSSLVRAREGTRNATLFETAVRVFEVVKAEHIDRREAVDALERAARGTGLEAEEIRKTMESAWQRAQARPPEPRVQDEPEPPPIQRATFLTLDDLKQLPPARWLVPGILPEGMTVLYGMRGGGKTFFALDVALTVASHGHTVVYCAGEGVSGLMSRIDAWALEHPDLDPSGHFRVLANASFPRLLRERSVFQLFGGFEQMERDGHVPKLIVVDTWRRALAGASTSSDEATTQALDVLDTLRDRWGTSSLILHHPRKPSKEERNPPEAGSGALGDNADFIWKLVGLHDEPRQVWNEKAKDFEEQSPLTFHLRPRGQSLVVSPSASEHMGGPRAMA